MYFGVGAAKTLGPLLILSAVNRSSSRVVTEAAVIRTSSALWNWLENKQSIQTVPGAYDVDWELERGDKADISIRGRCILEKNPLRIGVRDTFGRIHWAPREDLKRVMREYVASKQKTA
jgi:hypothetical protein